ncbi:alpha/beta-hydrolase [Choiromyces venosus 120613-1]|uniref:Carboxylic ester hydrolase n=1 Tax=Choiromyces venosus 120613-1 TaxID=1336337 RepID=A0A3N4JGT7_9PEZI|nr:alpha/beta-hydrolase [Choiromyces venosus 120613-1]
MTISPVLEHPSLGSRLRGVSLHDGSVVQFRGIKFGEFTKRYARSTMVESYPPEIDCTSHGPMCPQSIFDDEGLFFRIPENQRKRAAAGLTQDEFECLNLVITAPSSILNSQDAEEILPVFVNIHGGANKWISGSVPLIDMANFVKKSIDIGKPIVTVGINYRLSTFGYGVLPGGLGAHNGLFDQRLALKWVQKHIRGFRGDSKMVTIGGNSAGSFAVEVHLNRVPESDAGGLFNRAIMQSGTLHVSNPQQASWGIDLSKKIAKNLGADVEKEGWEEVLKTASAQDVVAAIEKDGFDFLPLTDDGGFFTKGWGEIGAAAPEWCDALLIGDAEFDGSIFVPRVRLVPPEDLIAAFRSLGAAGEALLSAYQIPTNTTPSFPVPAVTKRIHDGTLQFLSDLLFSFPNHRIATTWRSKNKEVYEYNYDQPNPWGPQNRRAHHAAEMPSLFGNYTFPEETHKATSKVQAAMQEHFISFIRGDAPFMAAEGEAMGYGPAGKVAVGWKKDRRNVRAWEIMQGLRKADLVKAFDTVGGCIGHYDFSHSKPK